MAYVALGFPADDPDVIEAPTTTAPETADTEPESDEEN